MPSRCAPNSVATRWKYQTTEYRRAVASVWSRFHVSHGYWAPLYEKRASGPDSHLIEEEARDRLSLWPCLRPRRRKSRRTTLRRFRTRCRGDKDEHRRREVPHEVPRTTRPAVGGGRVTAGDGFAARSRCPCRDRAGRAVDL